MTLRFTKTKVDSIVITKRRAYGVIITNTTLFGSIKELIEQSSKFIKYDLEFKPGSVFVYVRSTYKESKTSGPNLFFGGVPGNSGKSYTEDDRHAPKLSEEEISALEKVVKLDKSKSSDTKGFKNKKVWIRTSTVSIR